MHQLQWKSQTREAQAIHGKNSEGENQVPDATETMLWMLRANKVIVTMLRHAPAS